MPCSLITFEIVLRMFGGTEKKYTAGIYSMGHSATTPVGLVGSSDLQQSSDATMSSSATVGAIQAQIYKDIHSI